MLRSTGGLCDKVPLIGSGRGRLSCRRIRIKLEGVSVKVQTLVRGVLICLCATTGGFGCKRSQEPLATAQRTSAPNPALPEVSPPVTVDGFDIPSGEVNQRFAERFHRATVPGSDQV